LKLELNFRLGLTGIEIRIDFGFGLHWFREEKKQLHAMGILERSA